MARTMKAAVVKAFGKPLAIEEVPVPEPGVDAIQVKIEASGVCHTDLHAAQGDWPVKPKPPFIPGHEGVGFVSALGRNVKALKEGDRVGVPWLYTACGHCEHCLAGWETLCEAQQNTGYSVNGGFAEYADLQCCSQRNNRARLDRRHPARPPGIAGIRCGREGERDSRDEKKENINDVFPRMHKGEIERRIVLDLRA